MCTQERQIVCWCPSCETRALAYQVSEYLVAIPKRRGFAALAGILHARSNKYDTGLRERYMQAARQVRLYVPARTNSVRRSTSRSQSSCYVVSVSALYRHKSKLLQINRRPLFPFVFKHLIGGFAQVIFLLLATGHFLSFERVLLSVFTLGSAQDARCRQNSSLPVLPA